VASRVGELQMAWFKTAALAVLVAGGAAVTPAAAGDYNGDFLVRLQGTIVAPDASADVSFGGVPIPGSDADVSTEVIPALTLTYFINKNLAVELFCCFAKHQADAEGSIGGLGEVAETWIFPPALTLQYHFDLMGGFKPYFGAGVQYIYFFNEKSNYGGVEIDDALGFTLQAGVDVELGQGWYLNADVKKTWLDTEVTWRDAGLTADVDIDPWIFSVGLGYRFNLSDIFGARHEEASLK
jgi:outer membrane protein